MSDIVERLRHGITLYSACLESADKHMNLLSEAADEIESLRQQLTDMQAEIEISDKLQRERIAEKDAEIATLRQQVMSSDAQALAHYEQLAAGQLREQQLREALNLWKSASDNSEEAEFDDMACYCVPMPLFCDADEATDKALAVYADTTALEAMIAKAGEVMREEVIEQCIAIGIMSRDGRFVEEIRAIPSVALEDLRK